MKNEKRKEKRKKSGEEELGRFVTKKTELSELNSVGSFLNRLFL